MLNGKEEGEVDSHLWLFPSSEDTSIQLALYAIKFLTLLFQNIPREKHLVSVSWMCHLQKCIHVFCFKYLHRSVDFHIYFEQFNVIVSFDDFFGWLLFCPTIPEEIFLLSMYFKINTTTELFCYTVERLVS